MNTEQKKKNTSLKWQRILKKFVTDGKISKKIKFSIIFSPLSAIDQACKRISMSIAKT